MFRILNLKNKIFDRYWKLVVKNNFCAAKTSFHGIEFFGFDTRLQKLLAELNLSEYTNILVKHVNRDY
jgi:hypothetical protein